MRDKPKLAKQVREEKDYFLMLLGWCRTGLQAGTALFVICLAYLSYGVFSGSLDARGADPRILANLTLMGKGLTIGALVAAASFTLLMLEELAISALVGLIGLGLMFGIPAVVHSHVHNATAAKVIDLWAANAGMAILAIVGLRIVYEIVQQFRQAGERRDEEQEREEAGPKKIKKLPRQGVWSACWKLPYCHDAVRELCPAYKARRSCWRYGYGCNCDPSLIESLIRSGAMETGKGARATAKDKRVAEAYVRSDLAADAPTMGRMRTIPCSKCPIYMDHQRQKFRIVNPIAIVATLAALGAAYLPLSQFYTAVITAIAKMASQLTYGTSVDAGAWFDYLNTSGVKAFFFVIVTLLALAYVLKFVEWAIFEKKL
jgi:hypothetical protein